MTKSPKQPGLAAGQLQLSKIYARHMEDFCRETPLHRTISLLASVLAASEDLFFKVFFSVFSVVSL